MFLSFWASYSNLLGFKNLRGLPISIPLIVALSLSKDYAAPHLPFVNLISITHVKIDKVLHYNSKAS